MTIAIRLLALCGIAALAACETVEGAGEDIQAAGQAIERESNQAQY